MTEDLMVSGLVHRKPRPLLYLPEDTGGQYNTKTIMMVMFAVLLLQVCVCVCACACIDLQLRQEVEWNGRLRDSTLSSTQTPGWQRR